jgi:IPTL-CTERM motif
MDCPIDKEQRMKNRKWLVAKLAASIGLICISANSLQAAVKAPIGANVDPATLVSTTNGILVLQTENSNTSDLGAWSVSTGASHPNPGQFVLFPVGTSYISLRDATSNIMYANTSGAAAGLPGYTFQNLSTAPGSGVVTNLSNGYRTVWTIPSWTVTQDTTVNGSTLSDTNVQETVTVCNTTGAPRQYGVRFMWDWYIAGNDASFFRTRNPDTAFSSTFITYNSPTFQLFEETNNIATPLFTVFGTVGGGPLTPTPSTPEQLRYSSWGAAVGSAWDFTNTGGGSDSATEHYWGFNAPLTLAGGACGAFTQYLATTLSGSGGGGGAFVQTTIPTLSEWGLILLIVALGGISLWSLRRKMN